MGMFENAIAYFSKMGYTVNIPITGSQDYDLIIDWEYCSDGGRAQVCKTCT